MSEHPRLVARRIAPDPVQVQVILGSLLGDACLVGGPGERRLRVAHRSDREAYVRWKYERLGALAGEPPRSRAGLLVFETVVHPLFDDLAHLFLDGARETKRIARPEVFDLLRPLGLAVWMTDMGRLELRADAFLPAQRAAVLESS